MDFGMKVLHVTVLRPRAGRRARAFGSGAPGAGCTATMGPARRPQGTSDRDASICQAREAAEEAADGVRA